jgi:hypothetical protein
MDSTFLISCGVFMKCSLMYHGFLDKLLRNTEVSSPSGVGITVTTSTKPSCSDGLMNLCRSVISIPVKAKPAGTGQVIIWSQCCAAILCRGQ